jgi:hypothetical protein
VSFWKDFTDELGGIAKEVGRALIPGMAYKEGIAAVAKTPVGKFAGKTVSGIGEGLSAAGVNILSPNAGRTQALASFATGQAIQPIIASSGAQLTSQAQAAMTDITTNTAAKKAKQYDPLLVIGEAAEKKVFSPYVKRPIAAAALVTDPDSPLYDAGTYGEGFQFSDLQAAYERTKDVSLGVALTKSYLNPWHLTGISDAILEDGGVDINKVNLWDDKDVQKNFVDNVTGRYMSGITDALIGNVAIFAATGGAVKGAVAVGGKTGLSTTLKSITDFEARIDEHLAGKTTVIGNDITRLAASKDVNEIITILKPHTNNPRIINLIKDTESPEIVRDFILADKGYAPAIARLTDAKMSDDLWVLSGAKTELQADFIATGKLRTHTYEQRQRIAAAFDDAIAKNPKHQEIYDAFLQDRTILEVTPALAARGVKVGDIDSVPRMSGKLYQPPEPILGSGTYAKVRSRVSELKAATASRDYTNVGGWTQQIVGKFGAPTTLIKIATTRMPRGLVTNSGLRPMDAVEEINAHLDDLKLFTKGSNLIKISQTETISVSEYRTRIISDYLSAGSDGARGLIVDNLNEKLIRDVARTYGVKQSNVDELVEESMYNLRGFHKGLEEGYAMDPSGIRYVTDELTQRQLRNSTPLLNVGAIERDILRAQNVWKRGQRGVVRATDFVYEAGNRAFSFTQLVRPAYITKNSIIEPAMVSILSQGSRAITAEFSSGIKNAIQNNKTRVLRGIDASQNLTSSAKRELAKDFNLLSKEYSDATELLDEHIAEYIKFFDDPMGRSPQTKIEYADIVKRDLAAAEKYLRSIEEKLNAAAPEFTRQILKQPSLYNLTRRYEYLKKLDDPRYASELANARATITKAAGDIETLAPNLKAIDSDIALAYKNLEEKIQGFGKLHADKADLFMVSDGRTINYGSQKPFTAVMDNGEKIEGIPQFGDKNFLGDGYQSEVANTHTRQIELTGDKLFAQKVNIFSRKGPQAVTDISSPHYFDELAFVVNNYMRGDVLVDKILAGATRAELLAWGKTRQARSYAYEFGKTESDIVDIINNQIGYVNRYLPSAEAQRIAGLGAVDSKSLAKILADEPQALTPIQPLEVAYSVKSAGATRFVDLVDQLSAKAWTTLAKPENMFRYAWASTEYKTIMTDKLKSLYAMGYDVDATVINGIRTSAATEVVQNLEKTFYSIRRANRALFMARTVAAFPTAAASGIYRYSRLAVKNPARAGGFLNSYYGLYNSFGVDKYGNPVENVLDAEYLVVPGTKEMTNSFGGQGLKFPIRATTFMVNFAGPSWIVPIPMGVLYSAKKGSDKEVKKLIDNTIGKIPGYSYDELFPYGVETSVGANVQRAVTPGWLPALRKYLSPNGDGTVDWMNSVSSEFKYQQILYDAGLGPEPTSNSVIKQVRKNYFTKFQWQFGSIIGTPAYVETKPGNVFSDLFNSKANAYVAEGKSRTEAADLAEQDVNQMLRLPKGTISQDVLRLKSLSKSIYAPSSQETVSRIWVDHKDLAKKLELLEPGGSLVGLMTADIPYGTDSQAGKFLSDPNTTLPGGTILNKPVKSIEKMQRDLEVSQYWKAYTDLKNTYNIAAQKADYASYRSVPELVAELKNYAKVLGKASPQWNTAYLKSASGDNAAVQAAGIQVVLNDKSYMDKFGSTQFWTHAQAFIQYRDSYAKLYADVPSGYKGKVSDAWLAYLEKTREDWDPALANIIDRYFLNDNLKQTNINTKKSKENK